MTYDDTDLIVSWRNTDSVRKNFIYQALFTRESHENWIRTKVETGDVVQMIICETGSDRPVGSVYVRDVDLTHHKAEYGIFIGEADARGKGYGTAYGHLKPTTHSLPTAKAPTSSIGNHKTILM